MASHRSLTGSNLHLPFHYEQTLDPGAVGAGKWWADLSNRQIKRRNSGNTNWDAFDPAPFGGEVPNAVIVPPGSSWTTTKGIIDDADPGSAIYLPNETIIQTSGLLLQKAIKIYGTGVNSRLMHNGDISQFGSGVAILIDNPDVEETLDEFEFAYFTMECNRAVAPAGTRTVAIRFGGSYAVRNILIHHMTFKTISSSALMIAALDCEKCMVHHNVFDEFYEQAFEVGSLVKDLWITNNVVTVTQSNRTIILTIPMGFILDIERPPAGDSDRVVIADNVIDFSGLTGSGDMVSTHCIRLSNGQTGTWNQKNVVIAHNFLYASDNAIDIQGCHGSAGADPEGITLDMITHLEFNNANGTTATDQLLYREVAHDGNNFTNSNVTFADDFLIPEANLGGCQVFVAASSAYYACANDASLQVGDVSWTWNIWVKLATMPANDMTIVSKFSANNYDYDLCFDTFYDKFALRMSQDGSTLTAHAISNVAITTDTWYMVTAYHDATNNLFGIAVNASTPVTTGLTGGTFGGTGPVEIGRINSTNYFNGKMALPTFWKRVVTSAQRTSLYNTGAPNNYYALLSDFAVAHISVIGNTIDDSIGSLINITRGGFDNYNDTILISGNTLISHNAAPHIGISEEFFNPALVLDLRNTKTQV